MVRLKRGYRSDAVVYFCGPLLEPSLPHCGPYVDRLVHSFKRSDTHTLWVTNAPRSEKKNCVSPDKATTTTVEETAPNESSLDPCKGESTRHSKTPVRSSGTDEMRASSSCICYLSVPILVERAALDIGIISHGLSFPSHIITSRPHTRLSRSDHALTVRTGRTGRDADGLDFLKPLIQKKLK